MKINYITKSHCAFQLFQNLHLKIDCWFDFILFEQIELLALNNLGKIIFNKNRANQGILRILIKNNIPCFKLYNNFQFEGEELKNSLAKFKKLNI